MHWKKRTRAECCYAYYQWAFRECMGDSYNGNEVVDLPSCIQQPDLSGKWYLNDIPELGIYECVRECPGRSPCNGRAPLNQELFDTFAECCQERTWWTQSCTSPTGSQISECSDTFWDSYDQLDDVGYYPVCEYYSPGV